MPTTTAGWLRTTGKWCYALSAANFLNWFSFAIIADALGQHDGWANMISVACFVSANLLLPAGIALRAAAWVVSRSQRDADDHGI